MGMFDVEYTFDNLLRTSSEGIEMSSFVQMKDAIAKRYKEIFGNDIDLDSASADGQYLMMIALMLFNGYSGLYYLNQNLDPAGAQGTFLDRLCSFNNIFRKNAEPSYAYLYVSYVGTVANYVSVMSDNSSVQEITCIDQAGITWKWEEGKGLNDFLTKFSKDGRPKLLKFVCEEKGEISAEADASLKNINPNELVPNRDLTSDNHGWISQTIDKSTYPFEVWQANDAVIGHDDESDTALRQRRLLEIGNNGVTVLNGVRGSLSAIEGVEEVKVYTNVTKSAYNNFFTKDGSTVNYHDVYVITRYKEGVDVDNTLVGQTIYNKMTPGIVTAPLNERYEEGQNGGYVQVEENLFGYKQTYSVNIYQGILRDEIYWKRCKPVNPSMVLKFMYNRNLYEQGKVSENEYVFSSFEKTIIETLKKYTFGLTIFDNLNVPSLMGTLNTNSPVINNQTSFIFIDGKIAIKESVNSKYTYSKNLITFDTDEDKISTYFENCDTYYNYKSNQFVFDYYDTSENKEYLEAYVYIYESFLGAPDESEDLLGKKTSNLISKFEASDSTIYATLKYVTGYTGFSSKTSEQSGYYLPIKVNDTTKGATVKVTTSKGSYTLDPDNIIVLLVDKNTNPNPTITISVEKNGVIISEKEYTTSLTYINQE